MPAASSRTRRAYRRWKATAARHSFSASGSPVSSSPSTVQSSACKEVVASSRTPRSFPASSRTKSPWMSRKDAPGSSARLRARERMLDRLYADGEASTSCWDPCWTAIEVNRRRIEFLRTLFAGTPPTSADTPRKIEAPQGLKVFAGLSQRNFWLPKTDLNRQPSD